MIVFPEILKMEIWDDRKNGFSAIKYLGFRPALRKPIQPTPKT